MTQKDIIAKAYKMASKHFDVVSISFETYFNFQDNSERLDITIFYTFRNVKTNFSAHTYSHREIYSIESLFLELKHEIQEELQKIYPDRVKTTEIEIEL